MLAQEPTKEMVQQWHTLWNACKDKLRPNRKSGRELLHYLLERYTLTEIFDEKALRVIAFNVTENSCHFNKLPRGAKPFPRSFYLENRGNGRIFYKQDKKEGVCDNPCAKIFVGVDLESGFYIVEGSERLWDELYAFRGIDAADIENPYCVAQYMASRKVLGLPDL